MHSYRWDDHTKLWEVFFEHGVADSNPRTLKTFKTEIHAMDLVNYLNGGTMSPRLSYLLDK